jgi:hypothetical protein
MHCPRALQWSAEFKQQFYRRMYGEYNQVTDSRKMVTIEHLLVPMLCVGMNVHLQELAIPMHSHAERGNEIPHELAYKRSMSHHFMCSHRGTGRDVQMS